MKKYLFSIAFVFFLFLPIFIKASDKSVNLYLFWANGCPHCAHEKEFLGKIEKKYENLKIHKFEVSASENSKLFRDAGKALNAEISGVPFTVIGNKYFVGWYDEQTTGMALEKEINNAFENGCVDIVGNLLEPAQADVGGVECPVSMDDQSIPKKIRMPLFGELEIKKISLPFLTVVLGIIDGFNPCSMWVLLFLISLLLGMKDRKRMWILGGSFIVSSAAVYFLFMSAWLNLFIFLGFIVWIRIIIGLIALGSGGYNLKEYINKKESGCSVAGDEKRRKIFDKIKDITHKDKFWLALGGIIALAVAVNLVELICSAGIPAVYTKVLTLANLPSWKYYFYILIYIFFFMLDDLIVFFIAMVTLQSVGISEKYGRVSRLIGGIIMVAIGILLIFRPGWLMFG